MTSVIIEIAATRWRLQSGQAFDLSIPLQFDGPQPQFFGAAAATGSAVSNGAFLGDVRQGGSCNCATYTLTPHCNGTHTECVGHITDEPLSVQGLIVEPMLATVLVSVLPEESHATGDRYSPAPQAQDRLITLAALESAGASFELEHAQALIVRTLPNSLDKRHRCYDTSHPPPYFSTEAMQWIVDHDVRHLIVDLPSIDRASDDGRLSAHRLFWGMPPQTTRLRDAKRPYATITELAFIDDAIADGHYFLNLQIAPFVADAAPSRPILYRRTPA